MNSHVLCKCQCLDVVEKCVPMYLIVILIHFCKVICKF